MIDVTGIDKVAFAKAVYRLSVPKGLGILHAQHGELDQNEAELIAKEPEFHMDYVLGRACKMWFREEGGKLLAPDSWYDHTDRDYDELLAEFGLSRQATPAHGNCCECKECKPKGTLSYPGWEKANAASGN